MTVIILSIIITAVLTFLASYVYFTSKYERLLKEQAQKYRAKIYQIIDYFNHQGEIPIASTASGLIIIISWGLARVLEELETRFAKQDWNTVEAITHLREIVQQEFVQLTKKVEQWLNEQRSKLNNIYKDTEDPQI